METKLIPSPAHPTGEPEIPGEALRAQALLTAETFAGRVHVEWNPQAAVTPLGQLPFFIGFLKTAEIFKPWVQECPLERRSPNAPANADLRCSCRCRPPCAAWLQKHLQICYAPLLHEPWILDVDCRGRADAENNFDEITSQWGWGGGTTHDLKRCAIMARAVEHDFSKLPERTARPPLLESSAAMAH